MEGRRTFKMEQPSVLSRLQEFLPTMAAANQQLAEQMKGGAPREQFDIEALSHNDKFVIEMVSQSVLVAPLPLLTPAPLSPPSPPPSLPPPSLHLSFPLSCWQNLGVGVYDVNKGVDLDNKDHVKLFGDELVPMDFPPEDHQGEHDNEDEDDNGDEGEDEEEEEEEGDHL